MIEAPYLGDPWDEGFTSKEIPETAPEELDTGLIDQHGRPILRPKQRIKMGFAT